MGEDSEKGLYDMMPATPGDFPKEDTRRRDHEQRTLAGTVQVEDLVTSALGLGTSRAGSSQGRESLELRLEPETCQGLVKPSIAADIQVWEQGQ